MQTPSGGTQEGAGDNSVGVAVGQNQTRGEGVLEPTRWVKGREAQRIDRYGWRARGAGMAGPEAGRQDTRVHLWCQAKGSRVACEVRRGLSLRCRQKDPWQPSRRRAKKGTGSLHVGPATVAHVSACVTSSSVGPAREQLGGRGLGRWRDRASGASRLGQWIPEGRQRVCPGP